MLTPTIAGNLDTDESTSVMDVSFWRTARQTGFPYFLIGHATQLFDGFTPVAISLAMFSIAPGMIRFSDEQERMAAKTQMERDGPPEDVVQVVLHFCDERNYGLPLQNQSGAYFRIGETSWTGCTHTYRLMSDEK